ncbi:50S ribosomal protein L11 methyltransferase [Gemmiger formicilis]|uniref:50S ribosomal protein L11 methyltransferase n=1 Tax=Gemmiger formicilis TaxID=745368 RepID=UPI003F9E724E
MYLAPDENPAEVLPLFEERLKNSGIGYQLNTTGVEQEDWQNAWKKYYHAMDIGERLAIVPGWEEHDRTDRIRIVMDPGMAFGTGTHETTSLCLETLDSLVKGGERVLDIGTGSGILAIAALKLGAGTAEGVDIDPMCVRTAGENAARNGVADRFKVLVGDLSDKASGQYNIITANIVAAAILSLAPHVPVLMAPDAPASSPAASSTSARTRCWPGCSAAGSRACRGQGEARLGLHHLRKNPRRKRRERCPHRYFTPGAGRRPRRADRQRRPPSGRRHARQSSARRSCSAARTGWNTSARSRPSSRGGSSSPSTDGTTSKAEPDCAVTLFAGYPKAGQAGGGHPPQRRAGRDRDRAVFQPVLRGRAQKRGRQERALQPHCRRGRQAGGPRHAAPRGPAAARFCRRLRRHLQDFDLVLFFYEGGGAPLREVLHPGQYKRVAIVTGSEGGFSVEEAAAAKAAGAVTVGP